MVQKEVVDVSSMARLDLNAPPSMKQSLNSATIFSYMLP